MKPSVVTPSEDSPRGARAPRHTKPLAHWYALLLVLRHRGYGKAEDATGVSRSTLFTGVKHIEKMTGGRFFTWPPFRLTPVGGLQLAALEEWARSFEQVEAVAARAASPRWCIMTSELVGSEYLPGIIADFEQQHPGVAIETECGDEERMRERLRAGTVHCALTTDAPGWAGFSQAAIATLPLALLAPAAAGVSTAGELWAQSAVPFRLAVSRRSPAVRQLFHEGLRGLGVTWPNLRELSSQRAVERWAGREGDWGLVVLHPRLQPLPGVRVLPLKTFSPVEVALFWRGKRTRDISTAVQLLRAMAG